MSTTSLPSMRTHRPNLLPLRFPQRTPDYSRSPDTFPNLTEWEPVALASLMSAKPDTMQWACQHRPSSWEILWLHFDAHLAKFTDQYNAATEPLPAGTAANILTLLGHRDLFGLCDLGLHYDALGNDLTIPEYCNPEFVLDRWRRGYTGPIVRTISNRAGLYVGFEDEWASYQPVEHLQMAIAAGLTNGEIYNMHMAGHIPADQLASLRMLAALQPRQGAVS